MSWLERWYAAVDWFTAWRWHWFGKPDFDPQELNKP